MNASAATCLRYDTWLEAADESELRAGFVLASAIAAPKADIVAALRAAFDMQDSDTATSAVESLLRRPFVERVEEGFRVSRPLAVLLSDKFREDDPDAYGSAYAGWLDHEQMRLDTVDPEERWFVRGRIAFYLAAIDPEASAQEFGATFAEPPPGDPAPPRSWLTALALQQEGPLSVTPSAISFFRGYNSYKQGRFEAAARHFEDVIDTEEGDRFRAISLHLWAVLRDSDKRSEGRIREAIRLSEQFDLRDNEVMSRNTLVFRLISAAGRPPHLDAEKLRQAAELAEKNLGLADRSGDPYLMSWCLKAYAEASWLQEWSDDSSTNVSVERVDALVGILHRARQLSEENWDLEAAASAVNAAASILRDVRRYSESVTTIETFYRNHAAQDAPASARRLRKTLGSMRRNREDLDASLRANNLLLEMDTWN